jgi:DNA-binding NtrC family response regulator
MKLLSFPGCEDTMVDLLIQSGPIALVGRSPAMTALRSEIATASHTQAKVLITGEAGVGKEMVARLIHDGGARAGGKLLAVNCGGVPETILESRLFGHVKGSFPNAHRDKPGVLTMADEGTLLLDNIDEMSPRVQAALLRFTETGQPQPIGAARPAARSSVRLISATRRDMADLVDLAEFNDHLFFRLNVIQIHIPALRHRGDDVRILLHHFLAQAQAAQARPARPLTAEAEERLVGYRWPGNVRELKNTAECLMVRAGDAPITVDDLPDYLRDASGDDWVDAERHAGNMFM